VKTSAKRENWGSGGEAPSGVQGRSPWAQVCTAHSAKSRCGGVFVMCGSVLLVCFVCDAFRRYFWSLFAVVLPPSGGRQVARFTVRMAIDITDHHLGL
jgi:hypothetical protein